MKKTLLLTLLLGMLLSLSMDHKPCGKYQGRNLYKGKEGGCYYLKGKEHKRIYVDKKFCKCK